VLRSVFTNELKQAAYVMHGTAKSVMALSKPDQEQLWRGVLSNNYDLYWAINMKLVHTAASTVAATGEGGGGGGGGGGGAIAASHSRRVPVRLVMPDSTVAQDTVSTLDAAGLPVSIGAVYLSMCPAAAQQDGGAGAGAGAGGDAVAPSFCVQGVRVAASTLLGDVAESLSHADNFLYLVHAPPDSSDSRGGAGGAGGAGGGESKANRDGSDVSSPPVSSAGT
jgi:autophagy-related protein 5